MPSCFATRIASRRGRTRRSRSGRSRVGDQLEAVPAGAGGDVDLGPVDPHAVLGRLDDRVGLGVDGRDAVPRFHLVPDVVAVGHAADRAVVAGREDRPVADDHRAHVLAVAGGAGRHLRAMLMKYSSQPILCVMLPSSFSRESSTEGPGSRPDGEGGGSGRAAYAASPSNSSGAGPQKPPWRYWNR